MSEATTVLMSDEFHDQPTVRVARTLSGWPGCTAGEFLTSLIEVLDKKEEVLRQTGLDLPTILKLAAQARLIEEAAEQGETRVDSLRAQEAREAVRKLVVHGLAPDVTAAVLDLDPQRVQNYVDQYKLDASREIVRLNLDGKTNDEISDALHVTRQRVSAVLKENGLTARTKQKRITSNMAVHIRGLRQDGMELSAIARQLDIPLHKVKHAIYGKKPASQG